MSNEGFFHIRSPLEAVIEELGRRWGWYFALGLVLIALGIGAATFAFTTTVASIVVFGWILLFAGVALGVLSFLTGQWGGFLLSLSAAILSVITGVMLVRAPLSGAAALTFVIASFLLLSGIFRAIGSAVMHFPNWGWSTLSGIASIVLGGMLFAGWPEVSLWFLGFYIGIDLVIHGFAWCMFATSLRSLARSIAPKDRRHAAA
jgi:uncharacterized membrane protein HdeD (DUF308 family)